MHVYYIMIKSSQKFWVVYVRYRFIPEQCGVDWEFDLKNEIASGFFAYLSTVNATMVSIEE